MSNERCLFCFAGSKYGTVIIKWLQEQGYEVVVYIPDVGQRHNLRELQRNVQGMGCVAIVENLQNEYVQSYIFPALQGKIESNVSLSEPCIAKKTLDLAKIQNCNVVAQAQQGTLLKQFQILFCSLSPSIKVLSVWSQPEFYRKFPTEESLRASAEMNNLYVLDDPYTTDLARQYIQAPNENEDGQQDAELPPPPQLISIEFRDGLPVRVTDIAGDSYFTDPLTMFNFLNSVGAKHRIGRYEPTDNITAKCRIVFEAPGYYISAVAHDDLENLTMDCEVYKLRQMFVPECNRLAKSGMWFSPEMGFLTSALRKSQERIDGVVTLQLYNGNAKPVQRASHASIYDRHVATLQIGDTLDATQVFGFTKVTAARIRAYSKSLYS